MDMQTLGIPVAFTILVASLLWIIIGGKGHWTFKMGFVAAALYFAVALWVSLGSLIGWPSRERLPEKFQVNWIVVKEMPPGSKKENSIFMWVTELDEDNKPKEKEANKYLINFSAKKDKWEPRAHSTGYSKKLHEESMKALEMIKAGKPVFGTRKGVEGALQGKQGDAMGTPGQGQGEGEGDGQGNGKGSGQGYGKQGKNGQGDGGGMSQNDDPVFHVLPPPLLPPKPK
jgi:hypothetical protein